MQTQSEELRKQLTHIIQNKKIANGVHTIATIKLQKIIDDKKENLKRKHTYDLIDETNLNSWQDNGRYYVAIRDEIFNFPSPWIEYNLDKKFQILTEISVTLCIKKINISNQISSEKLLFVLVQKLFNKSSISHTTQIIDDHLIYLENKQVQQQIDIPDALKAQHKSLGIFGLLRSIFEIINSTAPSISFYDLAAVLIKNPHFEVVTFDFFDTIIYRTSDDPKDIFISAAKDMLEKQIIPNHISPFKFKKIRIKAESIARDHAINRECTIQEIYQELKNYIFDIDIAQAIDIEIENECKHAIINHDVIELVRLAHSINKKIAIISDTYLGKNHIKQMLGKETSSLFDYIFTSSDHRSGKTQTLHSIVHQKIGNQASKCLHFGDNYVADVEFGTSSGATALLLPNGVNEINQIRAREEKLIQSRMNIDTSKIQSRFFAQQLKISHHASLSTPWNHFTYGAYVLGPIYGPYVQWAHRKISEGNFDKVFFAMREGYLINKIFSTLPAIPGHQKDIYISRKILFCASLSNIKIEDVKFAFSTIKNADIESKLALLNLNKADLRPEILSLSEEELFDYLLSDSKLKKTIAMRSASLRKRVLRHLFAKDYKSGNHKIALLDLGWNTTIQKLLIKCLELENINASIFGFYLMTTGAADEYDVPGKSVSQGYLVDGGEPFDFYRALSRNLEILEQCCNPPHGTVSDYNDDGKPSVNQSCLSLAQLDDISQIQAGVLKYMKHIHVKGNHEESEEIKKIVSLKLMRAMLHPTEHELKLFEHWCHDDNLFNTKTRSILHQYKPYEVTKSNIATTLHKPFTEVYWNSGSIAKMNQDLGELNLYSGLLNLQTNRLYFK